MSDRAAMFSRDTTLHPTFPLYLIVGPVTGVYRPTGECVDALARVCEFSAARSGPQKVYEANNQRKGGAKGDVDRVWILCLLFGSVLL